MELGSQCYICNRAAKWSLINYLENGLQVNEIFNVCDYHAVELEDMFDDKIPFRLFHLVKEEEQ